MKCGITDWFPVKALGGCILGDTEEHENPLSFWVLNSTQLLTFYRPIPPCLGSCSFQFFPDWSVDSFGSWVQSKQAGLVAVWPMFHVLSTSKDKDLMGYQNPFRWTYFDWFFPRVHTHSTISKFAFTRLKLFCPQTLWCYGFLRWGLKEPLPPISMFRSLPRSHYASRKCQP